MHYAMVATHNPRGKLWAGKPLRTNAELTIFFEDVQKNCCLCTLNTCPALLVATPGDFKTFLLLNPQLANGGLPLHYYTKKLLFEAAESRSQVRKGCNKSTCDVPCLQMQ